MTIAAVCNQKGGVGKTTLTINLGAALANLGQRVLLIDLDPQGHLTEGVGLQEAYLSDGPSLHDCLVGSNKGISLSDLVRKHALEPYDVIPATYQLMLVEQALYMARNREHKLKNLLTQLQGQYDWVLLDCPPALGNITDNAMNAARQVIVPVQAEATSLRALELLFDQIESIERGLNIHIRILAVVPNLVMDSAMSKKIFSELRSQVPAVIPFELRKRVLVQAAWSSGCSVFAYKPPSRVDEQTRLEVAELYSKLADLIMERVRRDENG